MLSNGEKMIKTDSTPLGYGVPQCDESTHHGMGRARTHGTVHFELLW